MTERENNNGWAESRGSNYPGITAIRDKIGLFLTGGATNRTRRGGRTSKTPIRFMYSVYQGDVLVTEGSAYDVGQAIGSSSNRVSSACLSNELIQKKYRIERVTVKEYKDEKN